jgi:uncharacterized protein (DUF58 family)
MSLTRRAFLFACLTVLLAIVGLWSADPAIARFWQVPAALLLFGLAAEGFANRSLKVETGMTGLLRARLGRPLDVVLHWKTARPVMLRFMAAAPAGFEIAPRVHTLRAGPEGVESRLQALPVRLGRAPWPSLRGRVLGVLGLAWWNRAFKVAGESSVEPDMLQSGRGHASVTRRGVPERAIAGAGAEVHELREYRSGDPLRSIDWKASARLSRWIARDFVAEQHLEIVLVLDTGRTSGVAIDRLTRLGHYVNAACRFAQHATINEDRVGLVTFADRPLVALAPDHGQRAAMRLRARLADAAPVARESNLLPAAARVLALCKQRALVVLMLDLDDTGSEGQLGQAIRLLRPKHLPIVCGILSPELGALREREAHRWLDPFVSLAAAEQIDRVRANSAALRQLGAPVVLAPPSRFEDAVLSTYDQMRARRRV